MQVVDEYGFVPILPDNPQSSTGGLAPADSVEHPDSTGYAQTPVSLGPPIGTVKPFR